MTPITLCKAIIDHYNPRGLILEPFKGTGNFYNQFPEPKEWCEIEEGRNFFDYTKHVDWIITNPPWSNITSWYSHALSIADNIVFLWYVEGQFTRKRMKLMKESGHYLRELLLINKTPKRPWPQFAFQLGCSYISIEPGDCSINYLEWND